MSVGQFFVALAIGCAIVTAYFVYKVVETTFAQLPMM